MQAVLNRKENKGLSLVDGIGSLIDRLEFADNRTKVEIENKIVNMGSNVVRYLVDILPQLEGVKRGVVAMSLIRIGSASIEQLMALASENENFAWVSKYLISEIV